MKDFSKFKFSKVIPLPFWLWSEGDEDEILEYINERRLSCVRK